MAPWIVLLVESPPVLGALRDDLEAAPLVDPEGAVRILRVDPQAAVRHPPSAKERKARRDQRSCQAASSPFAPDADVLDPAALDPQALVLLRVDVTADHPRDPVAVPRDAPQARVRFDGVVEEPVAIHVDRLA